MTILKSVLGEAKRKNSNCLRATARVGARLRLTALTETLRAWILAEQALERSKWANERGRKPLEPHQYEHISENRSSPSACLFRHPEDFRSVSGTQPQGHAPQHPLFV